jgi:hypothetical protein
MPGSPLIAARFKMDPNEAPEGYIAVLKDDVKRGDENICHFCDWRPQCQDKSTDFSDSNNRCMSYGVISDKTGETIQRKDESSVVFKLKA